MATTLQARATERVPQAKSATAPWYRDPRRLAIGGAVLVIVAVLAVWLVIASARRKEEFAARLFSQAVAMTNAGNLPQASSQLQRVITTYRGTEAAAEAVLVLNQVRMVSGQAELAATNLQEFLQSQPEPRHAARAWGLLGAAHESSKKFAEAGKAFEAAARAAELDYLKASYLLDAGRAYREAGQTQEAIRVYRTVVERYPDAPALVEAQVRLAELTAGAM